jgi:hypothetical protein
MSRGKKTDASGTNRRLKTIYSIQDERTYRFLLLLISSRIAIALI